MFIGFEEPKAIFSPLKLLFPSYVWVIYYVKMVKIPLATIFLRDLKRKFFVIDGISINTKKISFKIVSVHYTTTLKNGKRLLHLVLLL